MYCTFVRINASCLDSELGCRPSYTSGDFTSVRSQKLGERSISARGWHGQVFIRRMKGMKAVDARPERGGSNLDSQGVMLPPRNRRLAKRCAESGTEPLKSKAAREHANAVY
jgi:hypothetical protein